ncbi:MAG: hypothetical protein ABIO78_09945 [Thermoanaerobaculia bacterium]
MKIAAISIAAALIAVTGLAAHPPPGSVVVATQRFLTGYPFPPIPSTGRLEIYTESGAFVETLWDPGVAIGDVGTDPQQSIYASVGGGVKRFDPDGTFTFLRLPIAGALALDRSRSVVVSGVQMILKLLADGQIVGPFSTGAPYGAQIDLAADQCAVYFPLSRDPRGAPIRQINRFNVCLGTALPPLTAGVPLSNSGGLRLLPSGEILITNSAGVHLLTSDGALTRTYPLPDARYLAIAPTAEAFWVTVDRTASLIDLASGATLASLTAADAIIGIAVMGEPRAAFAEPAAIPLFSPETAILLLAALAGVGLFALPRL